MNLETERTCHAGYSRPEKGKGFGGILENDKLKLKKT
jgi:hypothetical protein